MSYRAQLNRAELGWTELILYIWAWDWYSPESLTEGWWRGLRHPESRLILLFVWAWVTSHLFFKKPKRILIRW